MKKIYGLIKPSSDAHSMGVQTTQGLLQNCGMEVYVGGPAESFALSRYQDDRELKKILNWLKEIRADFLGISYRLDPKDAQEIVGRMVYILREEEMLKSQGGRIDKVFFAGLPEACENIKEEHRGLVEVFPGGEQDFDVLLKMGVEKSSIPKSISQGSAYDQMLVNFAEDVIKEGSYRKQGPSKVNDYTEYGSDRDHLVLRLKNKANKEPLIRSHIGPYDPSLSRRESLDLFKEWVSSLAKTGYLDILSIGSSQLSQSHFGEDWKGLPNGGGVPVKTPGEYREIYQAARPMLVRTYAGTKNIPALAEIYEKELNISWHALSFWWFNELDGRGPYGLYQNLVQHFESLKYIGQTKKPFEANVSHHFSFRGGDDITYIVSAYLAAKAAKIYGIKTYVAQNMLNTPRSTWGVQDLAKSRTLVGLLRSLEDENFKIILQPRAGLDFFKPDQDEAKVQLAQVSAMMDDIEPENDLSPGIVHVVSYSEAAKLTNPEILTESIQITKATINSYRTEKALGNISISSFDDEINSRKIALEKDSKKLIGALESTIQDLYSPEGFYKVFIAGYLPVPGLWNRSQEYKNAYDHQTKQELGSVIAIDDQGEKIQVEERVYQARLNLKEAEILLQENIRKLNKNK